MTTAKKRINLTVDDDLYHELEKLKKLKDAPSLSVVVLELTREALEFQEDLYLSKIAMKRQREGTVPHKKVWEQK